MDINQKILITGANGMLGSYLCDIFSSGYKIAGIHRDKQAIGNLAHQIVGDLRDIDQLKKDIVDFNPDLIIHCAGLINMDRCETDRELAYSTNVEVTKNLVEICPKDCVFVYISTDQVYGELSGADEEAKDLKPLNYYGETKLLGEEKVLESHSKYIILRTNIFGWNKKANRQSSAEWMFKKFKNSEEITLFDDYFFSPIYLRFLGEAIERLYRTNQEGIFNIGSSKKCSKYEFGIELARQLGIDSTRIIKGSLQSLKSDVVRNHDLTLNVQKIEGVGIHMPNWKESISAFITEKKEIIG